jgi:hypothetical protein
VPFDLSWLSDSLVSAVTKRCVVETLFNKKTDQVDHAVGPYSGISCKGEPNTPTPIVRTVSGAPTLEYSQKPISTFYARARWTSAVSSMSSS